MSKRIIESMRNFHYFVKLRNTHKELPSKFFSRFFLSKIPKKPETKKSMNNFVFKFSDYKSLNLDTSQDIFIKELMKDSFEENKNKFDINTFYSDRKDNIRNINIMTNILNRNKKCQRYFKYNDINNDKIKILLTYSTHMKFFKDSIIYKIGSKQTGLYLLIKGQISLKSINPELIKRHVYRNELKLENIYNEIKSDEKFNLLNKSDDNILLDNFISKTNFDVPNQNKSPIRSKLSLKLSDNMLRANRGIIRLATLRSGANMNAKKIVQDNILKENFNKIQKDLSCTLKTYTEGDFFCDWDLIYDKPHTETAYAEADSDILFLPKKFFDKFFANHFIKTDNERKNFLAKRIEFLHINNVINLKPYYFNRDEIIYTKFDIANEFFVLYKGKGALMDINDDYIYKKKSDIIFNVKDLKTICYVGEGCIVGLESFNDGTTKYEYNFVIVEDNTIIYRVKMNSMNMNNYFQRKNKIKLIKQLNELYLSQNSMLPKYVHNKRLTYEEKIHKRNEEKIHGIFNDAKCYFSKRLLNEKKINTVYGDLNQITEMNKHLSSLSHKHSSLNRASKQNIRNKLPTLEIENSNSKFKRRSKFRFLTTINKSKMPSVENKAREKEKNKDKKDNNAYKLLPIKNNLKFNLDSNKSKKKESLIDNNNNIKKALVSKRLSLFSFNFKSNLFKNFSQKKEENKNIEAKKEDNFFDFYGDSNNDLFKTSPDSKSKNKSKLASDIIDEYISKTIKITKNKNDINYNSGNFIIPLFGSKKKKK